MPAAKNTPSANILQMDCLKTRNNFLQDQKTDQIKLKVAVQTISCFSLAKGSPE